MTRYDIWRTAAPPDEDDCENCGAHAADANIRPTVCGGPVLCQRCEWDHRDTCAKCAAYHAEDAAMLRAWGQRRKHPVGV